MYIYKKLIMLMITFFSLILVVQPIEAATILDLYLDDGTRYAEHKNISLCNMVDVTITTSRGFRDVTVNGYNASDRRNRTEWMVYNIPLKPGNNSLQVVATNNTTKETKKFDIYYMDDNVPGAKYIITDFMSAKKNLKLFGGAFQNNSSKQNIIMYKNKPAAYQHATVTITEARFKPAPDMIYMSNIFTFIADYSNYCTFSEPSELTLSYAPDVSGTEAYMLTVLQLEPHYSLDMGFAFPLVRNLGGVVDTGSRTITVPLPREAFGHYVVVKKAGDFRDFYSQGSSPSKVASCRPYVLTLWAKGIMSPLEKYPDGKPVPKGYFGLLTENNLEVPITRKEMSKLLVKALQMPLAMEESIIMPTFSDLQQVPLDERIPIETATRYGLFSGFPDKNGGLEFRPNASLTRQQAAVILSQAAGADLIDAQRASAVLKGYLKYDYQKTEAWTHPYIFAAIQKGLIQITDPGYFHPDKPFTRADAAKAVWSLMKSNSYL